MGKRDYTVSLNFNFFVLIMCQLNSFIYFHPGTWIPNAQWVCWGKSSKWNKARTLFFLQISCPGFFLILQVLDFISRNVFHFPVKYQCCSFTPQDIVYSLHTLYCNKSNYVSYAKSRHHPQSIRDSPDYLQNTSHWMFSIDFL